MNAPRTYELWEPEAAPNNGRSKWEATKDSKRPKSYDRDWERWSYPIGNGYTGVCIFGRTDTERVQITDKTLHNKGIYGKGGLTSFAELFLDFNQTEVKNYRRSLNLNEAIAHVSYEHEGCAISVSISPLIRTMSSPSASLLIRKGRSPLACVQRFPISS